MEAIRGAITVLLLLVAGSKCYAATCGLSQRPNIVFILLDDVGWGDMQWIDSTMRTANIKAVGDDGRYMNQSYSIHMCSPSRAAFLSGRYPHKYGLQYNVIYDNNLNWLPENLKLLPHELKALNYTTHMIGKWHLGFCDWDLTPLGRGFDTFYGKFKGNSDYFTHTAQFKYIKNYYDFFDQTANVSDAVGKYSTTLFSQRAVEIIENHQGDRPFFLYLAYQTGHIPYQVPDYYRTHYCSHISDWSRQTYCAMVACADEGIGNITAALKAKGIYDNTVVVVASDNGADVYNQSSSNYPWRGGKITLWEGGTRFPTVIKPAGTVTNPGSQWGGIFHVVDWNPTLVQAACGDPGSQPYVDGIAQYNDIVNGVTGSRTTMLYNIESAGNYAAVRDETYKLIRGNTNKWPGWYPPQPLIDNGTAVYEDIEESQIDWGMKLYNLKTDSEERNNIYYQYNNQQFVKDLEAMLATADSEVVALQNGGLSPVAIGIRNQFGHWAPGWCSVDAQYGPCASTPCQNGGTCFVEDFSYRCECPYRASGSNCQTVTQCNAPSLSILLHTNVQSSQTTAEGTLFDVQNDNEFAVEYFAPDSDRFFMESVTFKLLNGDAVNVKLALFEIGWTWNDVGFIFLPNVNKNIEMTVPYLKPTEQTGTRVRFTVTPASGASNIQLLVKNVGCCIVSSSTPPSSTTADPATTAASATTAAAPPTTTTPPSCGVSGLYVPYTENAIAVQQTDSYLVTPATSNATFKAVLKPSDNAARTFKSVGVKLINGAASQVDVFLVGAAESITVHSTVLYNVQSGALTTIDLLDSVGYKLRFVVFPDSVSPNIQLEITDVCFTDESSTTAAQTTTAATTTTTTTTAAAGCGLFGLNQTFITNAASSNTSSGYLLTPVDSSAVFKITFGPTGGGTVTFDSITFTVLNGEANYVRVYLLGPTPSDNLLTEDQLNVQADTAVTLDLQATVAYKLRVHVEANSSPNIQLLISSICITA